MGSSYGEQLKALFVAPRDKLTEILLIRQQCVLGVTRQESSQRDLYLNVREIASDGQSC